MRRLAGLLMMAVAMSPCAQGPNVGQFTPPTSETTIERIYYFGDSHGALARPLLEPQWAAHQEYSISYNLQGGTFFQDWHAAMANVEAGSTVALELGTNNNLNETWMVTEQHLLQTLDLLRQRGVTKTVWFTINEYTAETRGYPYLSRVRWLNGYMADLLASGTYADIGLEISDWNSVAYPQGAAIIHTDGLHHNGDGNTLFAEHLFQALMP